MPISIHRCICRRCTDCRPQRSVLASYPRDESSVTICVDELDRLTTAKRCCHFRRSHFTKKEQKLSFAEWLASQRMLRSGFDDVRNVTIGETDCVRLVGDHCRKKWIDSGHTCRTTQRVDGKTRTAVPGTRKTRTAVPGTGQSAVSGTWYRFSGFSGTRYRSSGFSGTRYRCSGSCCKNVSMNGDFLDNSCRVATTSRLFVAS